MWSYTVTPPYVYGITLNKLSATYRLTDLYYVGFELLTALCMKSPVLFDITQCKCDLISRWFLIWLIHRSSETSRHFQLTISQVKKVKLSLCLIN
jgi:hypothetical protein